MQAVTTDRSDVIHLAGFRHLSPALDASGAPAFSAATGDGLTRCGWARFFEAMGERRLAVAHDPADPGVQLIPAGARSGGAGAAGLAAAVAHSRRFWRALFPPRRPGAAS